MNSLALLLDTVKQIGGNGKIYECEWSEVLPENRGAEIAIFFLNLQRVYVASVSKEGYIVGVTVNSPNEIGGAVSIFGHYCFLDLEEAVLARLDEFYGKLEYGEVLFDLQEELRANNNVDLIIHNIACELGYAV